PLRRLDLPGWRNRKLAEAGFGYWTKALMSVFLSVDAMPLGKYTGQRSSAPSIHMAISASMGGWSNGFVRTKKSGPNCAIGRMEPFTLSCMRTIAECPDG